MLSADLKVCLSSRPDLAYADAFDSCPKLRLQDLTELDIRTYSREKLQPHLHINTQREVSKIVDGIAERAQGVFLWVELVVKAMIKGLKNHDSVEQLQTRVYSTPSDIEALYAQMLSNIEVAYREEAAHLFEMALAGLSKSLLNVALALCNGLSRGSEMTIQEALYLSYRTQQRLPRVCAGLLEVHLEDRDSERGGGIIHKYEPLVTLPCRYANSSERADISYQERYAHVVFIHRTAMDFFRQSKQGRLFLEKNTGLGFSLRSTYVRGLLAKVDLLGFPEIPHGMGPDFNMEDGFPDGSHADDQSVAFLDEVACTFVRQVMGMISLEEKRTATAQRSLCDDVDRTLANVCKRHPVVYPFSHWSARWARVHRYPRGLLTGFWCSRRTSRSSFAGSFSSTKSEPTLCWKMPFDFLGVAAAWGLHFSVLEMLDQQQKHLDEEYASYLVYCSVFSIEVWGFGVPGQGNSATLNLLTELLSIGGNPNMYVGNLPTTIWGLFLTVIPKVDLNCYSTIFIKTMKVFIESDANVHTMAPYEIWFAGSREGQAGPGAPERPEMKFIHERSALHVVRSWLKDLPELKCVEEMISAKGGKDSHAYTHVALARDGNRLHKVSQRRQDKLIAALDEADIGHHDAWCANASISRQLGKIYKEISETWSDSESSASSDEDDASDDAAEEEFFESLDTLNVEDIVIK